MCRCKTYAHAGPRRALRSRLPRLLTLLAICIACSLAAGCAQEMANQPRLDTLEPLPEGVEALGPVKGTIARGTLQLDDPYFTGKANGQLVAEIPPQALQGTNMEAMLSRGQQRFVVFCAHCHGQVGGGTGGSEEMLTLVGMVVQRGFPTPPTYHQPRLRDAPIGHFFDVITNGLGRMPAHGYLIRPEDRWAIAAYIRALQLSQNATRNDLQPPDLEKLTSSPATH